MQKIGGQKSQSHKNFLSKINSSSFLLNMSQKGKAVEVLSFLGLILIGDGRNRFFKGMSCCLKNHRT